MPSVAKPVLPTEPDYIHPRAIIPERKSAWLSLVETLLTGTRKNRPRLPLLTARPRSSARAAEKKRNEETYARERNAWDDKLQALRVLEKLPEVVNAWKRPATAILACDIPVRNITRTTPFDAYEALPEGHIALHMIGADGSEVWDNPLVFMPQQTRYLLRVLTDPTWTPEDNAGPKKGDTL
jgi:hypothetical protein